MTLMKTLTIERLAHDLRGMAHDEGLAWFVEGALPGETVTVRELARHQQRVDAEVVDVLVAADGRVAPACKYYGQCGGCSLQHLDHAAQLHDKQQVLLDQLQRLGKAIPAVVAAPIVSAPWQYRRRARLACRWSSADKQLAFGLRARHSQQIVEIAHCAVLLPSLQALLAPLRECLSQWSQPRQLGHVELLAADDGVAILLRLLAAPGEADAARLQALALATGASIYLQTAEKQPPQFFAGAHESLQLGVGDVAVSCLPGDFVQGNTAVNAQLIDAVLAALQPSATDVLLEAFCGLGNFTLPLALQVASITALDLSEAMLARARQSAVAGRVQWLACDLNAFRPDTLPLPGANKILLDPPRDGAAAFCRNVPLAGVQRIAYVSCNPSTLARDAAILAERGLALRSVQLVDMFPQTSHIEALAIFEPDAAQARRARKEKAAKQAAGLKRLKR